MATQTVGTDATTTLTGVTFAKSLSAADVATIQQGIKNDQINGFPTYPGAFSLQGLLYVPNRGVLKVLDGDVIAWDPETGWPILISADAVAASPSSWNVA